MRTLRATVLAPVLFGIAVLVLWQLAVVVFDIKPFVLPSPLRIGGLFVQDAGVVAAGMLVTGTNALIGFVVGSIVGVVAAVVSALLRVLDQLSQPIVTAASVVPLVALGPVLYTMYGAGAETARQLIAALAVFVPVYLNTLRGLRQVRPVHRDLMRAYNATGWQATRAVTLPGALPYLFTGLRIGSSLAVISALVAEYFGGPVDGLATAITSAAAYSNFTLAYAFVLGAILLGLIFYGCTLAAEKAASRHTPAPS
ncbi:ABC transporter permease [uncultured Amnibacterium sp.]|uniref:ABC transporter permease n=1 Tax=uncultured Amnibacterium sp. TaxID=1631851 RepID=UPI0035CA8130